MFLHDDLSYINYFTDQFIQVIKTITTKIKKFVLNHYTFLKSKLTRIPFLIIGILSVKSSVRQ